VTGHTPASRTETGFTALEAADLETVRAEIRAGRYTGHTAGLAAGRLQCNLAILPKRDANTFHDYCRSNIKPCPLAGVSEPGSPVIERIGADVDIRTDAPRYNVYRNGSLDCQVTDLTSLWQDDFVTFAIGCSFTFENALMRAGIGMRHVEQNVTVPMYRSSIETAQSGPFGGGMVVSMRPIPQDRVEEAAVISSRYPLAHGGPVHAGDPDKIGILDVFKPDWGEGVEMKNGEVPVFWACGVTPQAAIMAARLPLAITHAPGAMLICDVDDETAPLYSE